MAVGVKRLVGVGVLVWVITMGEGLTAAVLTGVGVFSASNVIETIVAASSILIPGVVVGRDGKVQEAKLTQRMIISRILSEFFMQPPLCEN